MEDRKFSFIKSIDDKAYVRPGTSVGLRDVKKSGIYQPADSNVARKLPKYDWVNQQVYTTPSTHRILKPKPWEIDDFQPRVQLRKLYCNGEISSSNEVKIHECSEKYIVDEILVGSFILHLKHLDLLKRKREKQQSEKKRERNEKSYEDYS